MLYNSIVAVIPHTEPWNLNTATVMIICNLVTVAIGRLANANYGVKSESFGDFDLPKLIALLSFGHIIGVGFVLGLTNIGAV